MEVSGGEGQEPLLGPVFKGIETPGAEGLWKWILTARMVDSLASLGSSALPPAPVPRRWRVIIRQEVCVRRLLMA